MLREQSVSALLQGYGRPGKAIGYQGIAGSVQNASFRTSFCHALKAPESLEDIFQEAADTYGVPVNLLKAIGKAESGFDAGAVSSAGAQGVMQLMPATARALGVKDSFDARSNIMGGAKYMASLLERYQGDTVLALSAYNAGSGNVERYGGMPPFRETQNYVQKVMAYAGEDLEVGEIYSKRKLEGLTFKENSRMEAQSSPGALYTREDALYLVEMMRLQAQSMLQWDFSFYQE